MANFELNVKINGVEQSVSTIGGLEQALAATNAELAKVEKNSKEFGFLQNQANNLDKVLTTLTTDATTLNTGLKNVGESSKQVANSFTNTAQAANNAGDSMNTAIQETTSKSQSLRTELRKIIVELQNLEPGSARFQQLSIRAGELRDEIADTNQVVGALAGNVTERLGTALSGVANIGITALQGVTGGMQLFGVESEEAKNILEKLQGVLFLTQSIQGFGALPDEIAKIRAGFSSIIPDIEEATVATNAQSTASGIAATQLNAEGAGANVAAAGLNVQTGATEGATVATKTLNVAMRALPIVALVAGLATLAYGIYSYVSANNAATKAEEDRKKKQEELLKKQKELRDERDNSIKGTVQETVGLEKLLFQLKATANGTKQRRDLVKEINDTYGTTLKNLQDEQKFQEQLNDTIADYIAYQRVKILQDINDAKFTEEVVKQQQALDKAKQLNISNNLKEQLELVALGKLKQSDIDYSEDAILVFKDFSNMTEKKRASLKNLVFSYEEYLGQILNANFALEELGGTSAALAQQIEEFKKSLKSTEKPTSTVTKLTKEQAAEAQFLNDIIKERVRLEDDEIQKRVKSTLTLIDDLQEQRRLELRSLEDRFNQAIKTDKEEVKQKKKSKSEKVKIEEDYTKEVGLIRQRYLDEIDKQYKAEVQSAKEVTRQLIEQNKILNEEILFGDFDVSDQKTALNQKILQLKIDEINRSLENNRLDLESYQMLIDEKLKLLGEYTAEDVNIAIRVANAKRIKDLETFKVTQEQLLGVKIVANQQQLDEDEKTFQERLKKEGEFLVISSDGTISSFKDVNIKLEQEDQQTYDKRIAAQKKYLERIKGETDADYQKRIKLEEQRIKTDNENQRLSYENLIKQKTNLDEAYSFEVQAITDDYVNTNANTIVETDKDVYQKRLDLLEEFFSKSADMIKTFQGTQVAGLGSIIEASFAGIQDYFKLLDQEFANTSDKISAYAEAIAGAISTIINGFVQQNQANLQQDLTNLQINADAARDIKTQQYNDELAALDERARQGLLTEEQYTSALKALNDGYNNQTKNINDKLYLDQRAKKEKAFNDEKKLKIASTIISGLEGAVQAFTGAMQLGPIAGPIVGGILAAAIASLTAVNVSKISSTKFDGGPAVIKSESTLDSSTLSNSVSQPALASTGGFTSFTPEASGSTTGATTTPMTETGTGMQRVYVLESDITSAQDRVRVLENNSTFG